MFDNFFHWPLVRSLGYHASGEACAPDGTPLSEWDKYKFTPKVDITAMARVHQGEKLSGTSAARLQY
jgi:hypothetical protein